MPQTSGSTQTSSGGGVSKGATAGAIIAALVFLSIALTLFLWYRRRMRLRNEARTVVPEDVPAAAETVLKRPDPTEKHLSLQTEMNAIRVHSITPNPTTDPVPESQRLSPHVLPPPPVTNMNPFDDTTSIQTAGTEGTNVIPIALVPSEADSDHHTRRSSSSQPVRPARSPDLNLNLEHVNISGDSLGRATTPERSLMSSRNSYMSNASYSSDFLNEAPMIITPNKAAVRQVLGVVKAEVINAPGSLSSGSHLKPPSASRPTVGSPLASTSFGPADIVREADDMHVVGNPFSDEASGIAGYADSQTPSALNSSTALVQDSSGESVVETPNFAWTRSGGDSRPSSIGTRAGSIIDIGSATRVKVGSPLSPNTVGSAYRTTVGRLVSPAAAKSASLGEQQQRALAHAQAQAQAQGLDVNRRVSTSSAVSAASTRADSILESFPFVPPSPISNRPVRSPPVSPLGKQSFTSDASLASSSPQHEIAIFPPSPHVQESFSKDSKHESSLPPPPDRRTLGLSTGSQLSTASSGLGSFPFQIDSGDGTTTPPSAYGRQRASLDTLALTSDLSSYPLGFDRDSVQVPPHKN